MNWLSDFVRPKVQKTAQKEIADDLWLKCPNCGKLLFSKELKKIWYVCPECDHHLRLFLDNRLKMLFDNSDFTEVSLPKTPDDPLKFKDSKRYTERLQEYRKNTGNHDAIIVAKGAIGGTKCVVAALDFAFMGGSMGTAVGEAIVTAVQLALLQEAALILIPASGGARMQEGMLSLVQMARTTVAVKKLKAKKLPYIVVLTNPTTGGVTASFAMLGDVTLAEPGAIIGFAGARVIEQTIHQKLPPDFQKAELLLEHGMIDQIVPRAELRNKLVQILDLLMSKVKPSMATEQKS